MTLSIVIDDLNVTYPNGHTALDNINCILQGGRICGLVGVNGAGKSTLFKSIMGFVKPDKGRISICEQPVEKALKQNLVSYVPQSEDIDWNFPVLVRDVVMMGRYGHMGFLRKPRDRDDAAVDAALARVDMTELQDRQIGELSGGQRKRVFVARALAQGAQIILLDEPFTGVDVTTEETLAALFKSLATEGRLILVSTHNLGSVPRLCDDVLLINKKLLAYGAVETVFTSDNLAAAFGGYLRRHSLLGDSLHEDDDRRAVTVFTDDEHPLVFYGEEGQEKISRAPEKTS